MGEWAHPEFWACLPELIALLRQLDTEILRLNERASCSGAPVGAGSFDLFLQGEILRVFTSELARGQSLDETCQAALAAARSATEAHNARRPSDIHWQRAVKGAGSGAVQIAMARVERCQRRPLA